MSFFLQNLNGHMLCSVYACCTGPKPSFHDIYQIAVIPLNYDLKPHKEYLPFLLDIKPKRLDNCREEGGNVAQAKIVKALSQGLDSFSAQDAFLNWFDKMELGRTRKLMPLSFNWAVQREFIVDWLGPETTRIIFHDDYRDVMTAAIFHNDRSGLFGEAFVYPKIELNDLVNRSELDPIAGMDAGELAYTVAQLYYRILKRRT